MWISTVRRSPSQKRTHIKMNHLPTKNQNQKQKQKQMKQQQKKNKWTEKCYVFLECIPILVTAQGQ